MGFTREKRLETSYPVVNLDIDTLVTRAELKLLSWDDDQGLISFKTQDSRDSVRGNSRVGVLPDDFQRLTIPFGIWYSFKCISTFKGLIMNFTDLPHDSKESETFYCKSYKI